MRILVKILHLNASYDLCNNRRPPINPKRIVLPRLGVYLPQGFEKLTILLPD
jgi:hypothetical protein